MKYLALTLLAAGILAVSLSSSAQPQPSRPGLPSMDLGPEAIETTVKAEGDMSRRTWSDPAAGCHAAILARAAGQDAVVEKAMPAMQDTLLKAGLRVWGLENKNEQAHFQIEGDAVAGIGRLSFSGNATRVATLRACYWNEREPKRCQALCNKAMKQ